jgi:hypothetical protein
VLSVHGLLSIVQADDGTYYRCTTRRILKTLSTDLRHVVSAGDRVQLLPGDQKAGGALALDGELPEGTIERIEREIAAREAEVAELEKKLADDWTDVDVLAAHKRSRDALTALLQRWEQLFDQAQV